MSKQNPLRIDHRPDPSRMWGSNARTSARKNHCHLCGQCFEVGSWITCETKHCDAAGTILYAEPLSESFKRGGDDQPLLLCGFTGNA